LGGALDMGRYSVAARCVGQSQRCIDLAVAYAREREAFGQKIGDLERSGAWSLEEQTEPFRTYPFSPRYESLRHWISVFRKAP